MANTKLTLSMEPEIVYKAKKYAKKQNISLSKLVESYLDKVAKQEKTENTGSVPEGIKKLRGILKGPKNVTKEDLKQIRYEYLEKKNGI